MLDDDCKLLLPSQCWNWPKRTRGSAVEMFEILPRDWNLKPIFTQKRSSVDMNWGVEPPNPNPPTIPTLFRLYSQQDGAPAHMARQTQEWLKVKCTDFIAKDQWPPNSPDFNPPTQLPCVGCNASSISQTSVKAKDHPRAKKYTAADLGWLPDNDQQSYQRLSQTSEHMRFGRWWTFWACYVN